jgi:hypothetical protein
LSQLDSPFSIEEIDNIVKELPLNKAPGPDGFNGMFTKKCCPVMKGDFYDLINEFYVGQLDLRSINTSYITLVPKIQSSSSVNDYRPISLLGGPLKLITKLMANRVQRVITQLVHVNQYGFTKQRTIQHFLTWAFQYLHLYHSSKKEIAILKLDFEKPLINWSTR